MNENNRRPTVFPSQEQMAAREAELAKIANYEKEKEVVVKEIYTTPSDTPKGHMSAVEMMQARTANQLQQLKDVGQVKDVNLAEKPPISAADEIRQQRTEEQMRLRDEQLKRNSEQINNYQIQANIASERNNTNTDAALYPKNDNNNQINNQVNNYQSNTYQGGNQNNYVPPIQPPTQPPVNYGENFGKNPNNINPYILELSQPDYNAPFDAIPLPSQGKLNRGVASSVRIGYMTTADESILTSPNLLESGLFLEILINRKLREPNLRYKDLHIGDRNALMIWLRATSYGEMYPVTLLDEFDVPFDTEINLNELKTKELGAVPDADGYFDFQFKLCKLVIKFKLLTCGDVDEIEKLVTNDRINGLPLNKENIYTMERLIVEVNGDRNKGSIRDFANSIRIGDAKELNDYINKIESGIDLNIDVRTPGGGSIKTFLPLNINFFWPNIKL